MQKGGISMITRLAVSNFKAMANFELKNMSRLTCLIGLNGAGKTTFLQLLDFIGHLMRGESQIRQWAASELLTLGSNSRIISLSVSLELSTGKKVCWSGAFNVDKKRFREESVQDEKTEDTLLTAKDGILKVLGEESYQYSNYNFQGSILSAFHFKNSEIEEIKSELSQLQSLELLSPSNLRRPSQSGDSLGPGGEGLPGFLSRLSNEQSRDLLEAVQYFYGKVDAIQVKSRKFGWKNLLIQEYAKNIVADHINDGFLRVLAILSQRYAKGKVLLFDEIENGLNQELIGKLVDTLLHFNNKQVIVTTHSALVLNYIPDDIAKDAVVLLYRDQNGFTHAQKFFSIPDLKEQLEFMGPGQIMSQTDLIALAARLVENEIVPEK